MQKQSLNVWSELLKDTLLVCNRIKSDDEKTTFQKQAIQKFSLSADNKLLKIDFAGKAWLESMEKTTFINLTRTLFVVQTIMEEYPDTPELVLEWNSLADRIRLELSSILKNKPSYLNVSGREESDQTWRKVTDNIYSKTSVTGIPLSVIKWDMNSKNHTILWLAQLGGIAVDFAREPEDAIKKSEWAHRFAFGS